MPDRKARINSVSRMPGEGTAATWLTFPTHERLSGPDAVLLLQDIARTHQKLDAMAKTEQTAERTRAQLALKAYNRFFDLLDIIRNLQDQVRHDSK